MSVNVHIERLVLDGFDFSSRDAELIGASLEGELTRLIAARQGPLPIRGNVAASRGAPLSVGADTGAAAFGENVAQSVWSGMSEGNGAVKR